jgi:hypothetical protein
MGYKNNEGENNYLHGWLEAKPGSKEFKVTTGGNNVWAKTKREAIAKVNRERKAWEAQNPTYWQLRVNPNNIYRAKTYKRYSDFSAALYALTI